MFFSVDSPEGATEPEAKNSSGRHSKPRKIICRVYSSKDAVRNMNVKPDR